LFAVLPPGAFVGMGLLIALKNIIDNRAKERTVELQPEDVIKSESMGASH